MIIKKTFSTLSFTIIILFTLHAYSMEIKSDKHVIFDMGFLMHPNHHRFVQNLGLSGISQTIFSGTFNEEQSLQELFGVIEGIEFGLEEKDTETVWWKNQQVPSSMVSWLKNKVTCDRILQEALNEVNKQYYFTSRMNSIVGMVFDPEKCSQILSPCPATFNLINQLQEKGHTVHVMSNLHKDIRTTLVKANESLFSKINGNIIVSGDIGEVKCQEHSKMYQHFLKLLPDFQNVFFIETSDAHKQQIESLITYQTLKTIVANPQDLTSLTQKLQEEKLLPIARIK